MKWQDFLTDAERAELDKINADRRAGVKRYRQIYDRCRKRMGPRTKREKETACETAKKSAAKTTR